LEVKVGAHS